MAASLTTISASPADSVQEAWFFFCVTFGCKVNQYETQAIREAWILAGGLEQDSPASASLILVNSCAITGRAERDARNALIRLRREAPQALLVLTGCAARLVADFVPRRGAPVPEAGCIVVQERKENLCRPQVILGLLAQARSAQREHAHGVEPMNMAGLRGRSWPHLEIERYRRSRPVLKVQDGCTHRCTYCIVPYTRGPHVSRSPAEVAAEAARLWKEHAEIMLSGVNLGQYGRDHKEYGDFWSLLASLNEALGPELGGRRRLRISSLEPSQLDERGCRTLTACALVAPHLHISLQHASWNVLRRMGRGHYTKDTLTRALERLESSWSVIGLGADLLVGFPGETAADVDELCRFVEDTPFTYAHVFPYSRRPGTPAADFPDQLTKKEKLARAAVVRALVAEKIKRFREARSGDASCAIVLDNTEGQAMPGYLHGVSEHYVSCYLPADQMKGLPEGAGQSEFLKARPAGLSENGLLVELS